MAKKGNTIHEIKCAACGKHISFTHDQKQAKEELFCSGKCVKKIIKKETEVEFMTIKRYAEKALKGAGE